MDREKSENFDSAPDLSSIISIKQMHQPIELDLTNDIFVPAVLS